MDQIDRELIRRAYERIANLERALESRRWHPDDPMRGDLIKQIAEERRKLEERVHHLEEKRRQLEPRS